MVVQFPLDHFLIFGVEFMRVPLRIKLLSVMTCIGKVEHFDILNNQSLSIYSRSPRIIDVNVETPFVKESTH